MGNNVVELTGDVTPDIRAIASADVIVTTPEKWDGVSRFWQMRDHGGGYGLLRLQGLFAALKMLPFN